jgi:biopolymer transport protein ExbB
VLDLLTQGSLSPWVAVKELVAAGGSIVVWIMLACLVMWSMILERYWFFKRVLPIEAKQMLEKWQSRTNHKSWTSRQIRRAMISRLNSDMTTTLPLLRVMVPLCPLLGLIGTVAGMLEVFDAMALRGSADARTMASGVSQAMTCTLMGLAVSITGMYPIFYFQSRTRVETELLADKFNY